MSIYFKKQIRHIRTIVVVVTILSIFGVLGGVAPVYSQGGTVFQETNDPSVSPNSCQAVTSGQLIGTGEFPGPKYGCSPGQENVVTNVLNFIFGLLSVISLIFVVIGGLKYTLSGGSTEAVASAKKTILYASLGLALGISSFTIMRIILGALQ